MFGFRDSSLDQLVKGSEIGRLTDFRLVLQLHQWLVVLKSSNLILELVVGYLNASCSQIAFSRLSLLLTAIKLSLLFLNMLFYVGNIRRSWFSRCCGGWTLEVASWGEEELVSSMSCGWSMAGGGTVPPVVSMPLPLNVAPLRGDDLLFWGHHRYERGFLRNVLSFKKKILSVGTQFSMKAPVCGDVGRLIRTTNEIERGVKYS